MKLSDRGLEMIKKAEGFVPVVYQDQAGLPTIGYGHLLTADDEITMRYAGRRLTDAEGTELLRADVGIAERAIDELVRVPLEQHQYDALVDFVFNVGRPSFAKSTLLKKLNAGRYTEVPKELMRWNKVRNPRTKLLEAHRGLTRRRQREADLWNTGSSE